MKTSANSATPARPLFVFGLTLQLTYASALRVDHLKDSLALTTVTPST